MAPSLLPPPSLPPGARGQAALRRGPARPGSPQGKGCLCLKVTTRARCPGWARCLPFPGRGGGGGGPPHTPGGDRGKAHLPPHSPATAPLWDQPARWGGGQLLSPPGVGDQVNSFHCLGAMGRGRPGGLLPHPSLPSWPRAPFSPGSPGRHLGRGRRGRARRGDEVSPPPAGKSPSAAPLPSSSPKGRGGRGEEARGPGRGLPPLPPWNVRSRLSAAPLYPRQPAGGPGGTERRVWAGKPGGGVPAGSGRR